jgi:hypothetical protein
MGASPTIPRGSSAPASQQVQWSVVQLSRAGATEYRLEDGRHSRLLASRTAPSLPYDFERWQLERAEDLDGDGVHDALVMHFTGGAHCCFEYLIASSRADGIEITDWFSLGSADIENVLDLNGDRVPELVSSDNRFAYFPDLSFADSPFLPLVLCRSVTMLYYDCTARFPSYLQESADHYENSLRAYTARNAVTQPPGSYPNPSEPFTYALGLVASYIRMDNYPATEIGWQKVQALCLICYRWLSSHSTDLSEALGRGQPERYEDVQIDRPR